jgi:hypothetical protein
MEVSGEELKTRKYRDLEADAESSAEEIEVY